MKVFVAYILPPAENCIHGVGLECLAVDTNEQGALTKLRDKWDALMKGQEKDFDKDAAWQKMHHNYIHKNLSYLNYELHVKQVDMKYDLYNINYME